MNEILKRDITVKIIAVLIGIYFWFFALNSQNPYVDVNLTIPYRMINMSMLEQKNLRWEEEQKNPSAVITVRGRKESIDKVSENDFEAVLDFSQVQSVQDTLLKVPKIKHKLEDISVVSQPNEISILVKQLKRVSYDVVLEITGLEELERRGYRILDKILTPASISVKGAEDKINEIAVAKAIVDVSQLSSDQSFRKESTFYDHQGKEILGLGVNQDVDVLIRVGKEVSIRTVINGIPAEDYFESSRDIFPKKVIVTGTHNVLSSIAEVETEVIHIDRIDKSINTTVGLKLPQGIRLADTSTEIKVSVLIERYHKKDIVFPASSISVLGIPFNNGYQYEILNNHIGIVVKGRKVDLEGIENTDFQPRINVGGLGEGMHGVELELNMSLGVTLVKGSKVDVKIDSTRSISFAKGDISIQNADATYSYTVQEESILPNFVGKKAELDKLTVTGMKAYVDVAGLGKGTHKLQPRFTLSSQIKYGDNTVVTVVIE